MQIRVCVQDEQQFVHVVFVHHFALADPNRLTGRGQSLEPVLAVFAFC